MSTKPSEIIAKMEDLLRDPKRWTKGAAARDFRGRPVLADSPAATCWCVLGAFLKSGGQLGDLADRSLDEAAPPGVTECNTYVDFNDRKKTTHDDIMAHLARAKQKALEMEAQS
ncbi:DUF6197 family protein [Aestuariivirga sp. YIM B02566]|uniref:Uncharacterized protein n=1 Tax=Taklimakanibacter albus TaxID=2800327 RepID=A0ACC5RG91_9HYPH|nr:hypothetical protein [Aestuariivirga sp. YIM B02566]MBK1871536.1 hypothetical protein [Aestuariivirga sp. YIM B02566]